jgi:hypothetical protein
MLHIWLRGAAFRAGVWTVVTAAIAMWVTAIASPVSPAAAAPDADVDAEPRPAPKVPALRWQRGDAVDVVTTLADLRDLDVLGSPLRMEQRGKAQFRLTVREVDDAGRFTRAHARIVLREAAVTMNGRLIMSAPGRLAGRTFELRRVGDGDWRVIAAATGEEPVASVADDVLAVVDPDGLNAAAQSLLPDRALTIGETVEVDAAAIGDMIDTAGLTADAATITVKEPVGEGDAARAVLGLKFSVSGEPEEEAGPKTSLAIDFTGDCTLSTANGIDGEMKLVGTMSIDGDVTGTGTMTITRTVTTLDTDEEAAE